MMSDELKTTKANPADEEPSAKAPGAPGAPEGLSFSRIAYRQLVRNRLAMLGFAMVAVVTTIAVLVPFLANDRPYVIRTILEDDYDEAFASVLDGHDQCLKLVRAGDLSSARSSPYRSVLFSNLKRMASQLGPDDREQLKRIRDTYKGLFATGAPKESWDRVLTEITSEYSTETATLVPRCYFPLLRTLRPVEIFFLVLYGSAVMQWLIRRRSPPTWKRARRAVMLAVVVTVVWAVAVPPRTFPVGYFKDLAPQASLALFPPVMYGETETEALFDVNYPRPPTWLVSSEQQAPNYHVLGTDKVGRDVLCRMIYGARIAMIIGFVAVSIYITIGVIVGACAGFFRGKTDMIVSRVIEVVICFPSLFLIVSVLAYLPPSIINVMVVLGLTGWTGVARLTRGEFLRIVNLDYVSAIQTLGGSNVRIIFRHILPNGIGPVLVVASFGIAAAILIESALSFLGMGVPDPYASWGTLLYDGRRYIREAWWLTVFPGIAIFVTVTAWNLFGEGLRDAIDPRLKQ